MWSSVQSYRFNQPNAVELLQVADIAAAATARAFEADSWGVSEPRYLQELAPRLLPTAAWSNHLLRDEAAPWIGGTELPMGGDALTNTVEGRGAAAAFAGAPLSRGWRLVPALKRHPKPPTVTGVP